MEQAKLTVKDLPELVEEYAKLDDLEKSAKKQKTPLNTSIKRVMKDSGTDVFTVGNVTATYGSYEKDTMNEAKLLERLKQMGLTEAIQTVEKPDTAVIEDLIYKKKLDPQVLADCTESKTVETLSVKVAKAPKKKAGK